MYPEFKERYNILAAAAVAKAKKDKDAAGAVMKVIALDPEKFRLGHTKIFFRAGVLGFMEETREDRIGCVFSGCRLKQEARPLALSLRNCNSKSWPCTACKGPFVITTLVRPGFGGHCGCLSSLNSNVPSLPNTRLNMKKRLLLLRPTLTKLWLTGKGLKLFMLVSRVKRMSLFWLFKAEVLLFRI